MKDIRVQTLGKLNIKDIPEEKQKELFNDLYKLILQKKQKARRTTTSKNT